MRIREKDKQTLLQIFSNVDFPFEVWAYGSRVNGTAHEGSDLDLVIRNRQSIPVPPSIFGDLSEKIKDSNIPILVELRDWEILPERFHYIIAQQYEVVFSNYKKFIHSDNESIINDPLKGYKIKPDSNHTKKKKS